MHTCGCDTCAAQQRQELLKASQQPQMPTTLSSSSHTFGPAHKQANRPSLNLLRSLGSVDGTVHTPVTSAASKKLNLEHSGETRAEMAGGEEVRRCKGTHDTVASNENLLDGKAVSVPGREPVLNALQTRDEDEAVESEPVAHPDVLLITKSTFRVTKTEGSGGVWGRPEATHWGRNHGGDSDAPARQPDARNNMTYYANSDSATMNNTRSASVEDNTRSDATYNTSVDATSKASDEEKNKPAPTITPAPRITPSPTIAPAPRITPSPTITPAPRITPSPKIATKHTPATGCAQHSEEASNKSRVSARRVSVDAEGALDVPVQEARADVCIPSLRHKQDACAKDCGAKQPEGVNGLLTCCLFRTCMVE
jgi:hypothetical protein